MLPWWSFYRGEIGGVGQYHVNLANGNLVVQAADMDVPNILVPLNFTRAYNSLSKHDALGSDGSAPSLYGDGWTNNFDAHIAYTAQNQLTVYSGDGTRYDYEPDPQNPGQWLPPAGIQAQLKFDGGNGYYWIQKSGSEIYFYGPNQQTAFAAFSGRIYAMYGRNYNNSLYFRYSFDNGDASSSSHINQIAVVAQDGRAAVLSFQNQGTGGYRELASLMWPDGTTTVSYSYDTAGNHLTQVTEPGNGTISSIPQGYDYTSYWQLKDVMTPNYQINDGQRPGSFVSFVYPNAPSDKKLGTVAYTGTLNYTPNDNTGVALDPHASPNPQTFNTLTFTYGTNTQVSDAFGRISTYTLDGNGRLTQMTVPTGDPSPPAGYGSPPTTLTVSQTWYPIGDSRANRIASITDVRGKETDFGYDYNGNLIAIADPAAPIGTGGSTTNVRRTTTFQYDTNSNLKGYCDANSIHNATQDWSATPAPHATLCPTSISGSRRFTYTFPSYEPTGELSTETIPSVPSSYTYTFNYNTTQEGGEDLGLPTQIIGGLIQMANTQLNVVPQMNKVYDRSGNLICRSTGVNRWYVMQYDADGRMTASGDPDDYTLNGSACGKQIPSQNYFKSAYYYTYSPNGQVTLVQSPAQKDQSTLQVQVGHKFQYDGDGNLVSSTQYYGMSTPPPSTTPTINRWYDAADRLVEVEMPQDSTHDYYGFPWLTRYLYDLTVIGGNVQISDPVTGSTSYQAYGNLYKAQRYIPSIMDSGTSSPPPTTGTWTDFRGWAYDALNRTDVAYSYQSGTDTLITYPYYYDLDQTSYGLLSLVEPSAVNDILQYYYDPTARESGVHGSVNPHAPFLDDQIVDRVYQYDPDGSTTAAANALGAAAGWTSGNTFNQVNYTYDVAERLTQEQEPTPTPVITPTPGPTVEPSPTTQYTYYQNGWLKDATIPAYGSTAALTYNYQDDGALVQVDAVPPGSTAPSFYLSYNYDTADRLTSKLDSLDGGVLNPSTFDTYGRLTSWNMFGGLYSNVTYDLEDQVTGYSMSPSFSSPPPVSVSLTYSTRGELVKKTGGGTDNFSLTSADGFMLPPATQWCIQYGSHGWTACGTQHTNFDARNGAPLGSTWTPPPNIPGPTPTPITTLVNYDLLNRQNEIDQNSSKAVANTFDQENHMDYTFRGSVYSSPYVQYIKGADGQNHTRIAGSGPTQPTAQTNLYWMFGALLYSTNSAGTLNDFKVGTDADVLPTDSTWNQATVWDRDLFGYAVSSHNASVSFGHGYYSDSDLFQRGCATSWVNQPSQNFKAPIQFAGSSPPGCASTSNLLFSTRDDGYFDGASILQGIRTYEPITGTWTSLDPQGGGYQYDGNNPAMFSDPSGLEELPKTLGHVYATCDWDCMLFQWDMFLELIDQPQQNGGGGEGGGGVSNVNPPKTPKMTMGPRQQVDCSSRPKSLPKVGGTVPGGDGSQINEIDQLTWVDTAGRDIQMGYVYKTDAGGQYWSPYVAVTLSLGMAQSTVMSPTNIQDLGNLLAEKDLDTEFREQDPGGTPDHVEEQPCKS